MAKPEDSKLGQGTEYIFKYSPEQLFAIARSEGRKDLNNIAPDAFHGFDRWTAYELSWLDAKGVPKCAILEMDFQANSPNIIESKSLKLYLNSFNLESIESEAALLAMIKKDLEKFSGAVVELKLFPVDAYSVHSLDSYVSLDHLDISADVYTPSSSLLEIKSDEVVARKWVTHLFRSLCPVTSQPDWASIYIDYTGREIDDESLLKYLVSYRNHQGFHEQCVESIYSDLLRFSPDTLRVYGRFVRRGGIDINPFRSSDSQALPDLRVDRQ